jgi:tRNA(Arg) A34 adenosine deaminase TadA
MQTSPFIRNELFHSFITVCYNFDMENTINSQYIKEALKEARKAKTLGDLPFGAIVVCDEKIVGRGKCENNTTGDVTDHAEINALREACKTLKRNKLNDCIIYCTNEPCPMCASAIFQAKIPKVVFGATREDLPKLLRPRKISINELAKDSGYEIKILSGVMKKEVLKEFS